MQIHELAKLTTLSDTDVVAIDTGSITRKLDYATLADAITTDVATDLTALTETVTELSETVTTQGTDLDTLEATVETQGTSISTLEDTVSGHTTSIGTLTTDLDTLESTVSTLSNDVDTLESSVSTISSDLSDLSDTVSGHTTSIGTLESDLSDLSDEVDALVTGVSGVKGDAESSYRTGDVNLTPANIGAALASAYTSTVTGPSSGYSSLSDACTNSSGTGIWDVMGSQGVRVGFCIVSGRVYHYFAYRNGAGTYCNCVFLSYGIAMQEVQNVNGTITVYQYTRSAT